jgi:hypothetical protein
MSKVDGLVFAPDLIECELCPPTGCNLDCVWPVEQGPLLWDGDNA